jgi:hypothetical protein
MEIAIAGEGELVLRYIDKQGRTLMQERLVVSGSPTMEARHLAASALQTADGAVDVAPVLVRRSNARQRVTFDRQAPAAYVRTRCKEIGCAAKIAADAARGQAPAPEAGTGPVVASDDPGMARLVAATRGRRSASPRRRGSRASSPRRARASR